MAADANAAGALHRARRDPRGRARRHLAGGRQVHASRAPWSGVFTIQTLTSTITFLGVPPAVTPVFKALSSSSSCSSQSRGCRALAREHRPAAAARRPTATPRPQRRSHHDARTRDEPPVQRAARRRAAAAGSCPARLAGCPVLAAARASSIAMFVGRRRLYFGHFLTPRRAVVAAARQRLPAGPRRRDDVRDPHRRDRPLGRRGHGVHRRCSAPSLLHDGRAAVGRRAGDDRRRARCRPGHRRAGPVLRRAAVHRLAGRDVPGARPRASCVSLESIKVDGSRGAVAAVARKLGYPAAGTSRRPGIIALLVVVVAAWCSHYTRFGRTVYAIGGNEQSARLMGLPGRAHQGARLRHQRHLRRARRAAVHRVHGAGYPSTASEPSSTRSRRSSSAAPCSPAAADTSLGSMIGVLVYGVIKTVDHVPGRRAVLDAHHDRHPAAGLRRRAARDRRARPVAAERRADRAG